MYPFKNLMGVFDTLKKKEHREFILHMASRSSEANQCILKHILNQFNVKCPKTTFIRNICTVLPANYSISISKVGNPFFFLHEF